MSQGLESMTRLDLSGLGLTGKIPSVFANNLPNLTEVRYRHTPHHESIIRKAIDRTSRGRAMDGSLAMIVPDAPLPP
jgi:hypothetical protein